MTVKKGNSMYIMIDEGYCIEKITSLKRIVKYCENLTLQDGRPITKTLLSKMFKENCSVNVYHYEGDDLEEAKNIGSVRGIDWVYKFVKV